MNGQSVMRKVQSSPYGVSHLPHGMADSIETDSETGSFSDESINSVLGYQSYLSNINYLADHVDNDPMTRGLGASNGSGPYSYDINSPIGSAASKVGSREPGIHEYLTDFDSSTKEFTDGSKSFPEFSNLLGYILKSEFRKIMYADMFYHAVDVRREEHRNVVLRVSPTYSNISKIYGIFNEWYILSGLNAINGHHPLWSNDMLQNEYLPKLIEGKAEGPRFDPLRSDIKTPVTLPKGIDGVLYPLDAFCLPYYKDGKNIPSNNRMVLVYENYDYATLKVAQKDSYLSYFQDLDDYKVPLFQLSRFAQLSGKPRMSSAGLKEYFPDLGPFSLASSNTVKTPPLSASLNPTQLTTASLSALTTDFSNMETSGLPPKSKSRFFDELNHQVRQYSKPIVCIIELLSDFIKILKTLKTVHELGIVHNGLTTSNILKSTSKSGVHKNKIKLSGWDFYCSIQPEDCSNGYRKSHLRQVPDLLPYLSPESTGEANIPVDYRSDFYSIGIIMYELIVGCLPFQSDKPTTLLRMQILQKPIAPILLASNWVSEELSDIILKLLEKQPDDRYFDCGTIINDLIQVKSNYIDHVANSSLQTYEFWCNHPYYREYFVKDELLGGKDKSIGLPTMFFFPKTVYGRTAEFSSIFKTYESLSTGTNMIVLSGPYDYDKTAIMNELKLSPLSKSEFYFSWTFNNTSSNPSTYQCLIHGIRLIFQQVLATSPAQVTRWRELIVLKINVDLSIMFHKVPELKLILGTKYSNIYESRRQRQTNETNSSVSEQNDYFSTPHDNMVHDNTGEVDQYNQIIGSQDQTLNLEINFRYIIKVLYSLFGLDGLTIFFEDIQFCSPKEWGMISEAFEFFNANKIQDSVSIKIVASFGSQGSDEEKEKLFGYLSQANIVLHSVTLQKIDRESFKNFVEATLMVNKIKSNFSLTGDTLAVLRSPVSAADSTISKYVTGSPSLLASYAFSTLSTSSTSIFPVSINHDQNQDPRIEALSNFLYEKTNASAFHTFGFFIMLYLLGLITYKENGRGKGWNVIYNKYLFDRNEAFYGSDFFDTLSEEDLTILKYAAISRKGYHFYLLELITVSGFPMKRVVELLNMCLNCRLISAGNTIYKFPFHLIDSETQSIGNDNEKGSFFGVSSDKIKEIASQTRYRFSHDSLIQCLHSLMKSKGEFELYHKRCGMRIYNSNLKTFPKLTISQYLTMANHFVHSWKIATLPDERKIYFEVLIQAGRYASLTQKQIKV